MKLIWRNIWRNSRRAKITIASVFFAVFFCTLMNSVVNGLWEKMRDDALRTQTGHIQIHKRGYWDDKTIDNFMTMDAAVIGGLEALDNIENISPRIMIAAMASYGTQSKGVIITGISPAKEREKSNLPIRVAQGRYLSENDDGILIGEGLAGYLSVGVGDTVVFIGQGYHGASAVGLFPVRGLLRMPSIEMDNGLVYMTLQTTQSFIDMPDGYSGILVSIQKEKLLNETMKAISYQLSGNSNENPDIRQPATSPYPLQMGTDDYEVLPWMVTMEEMMKTSASHKGLVRMIMLVLYLIVGFGILGTVIMMTNERKREFAMMISLGMSRRRLKVATVLELILLTVTGVALATAVSVPLTYYFSLNPIPLTGDIAQAYIELGMEAVLITTCETSVFITQTLTVLFFAGLTFTYPVSKIGKLKLTSK